MAVTDVDLGFDTLACAQTSGEAGVEDAQAEAHAAAAYAVRIGLAA